MQRPISLAACTFLLGVALAAQAEPPSPAKDSETQTARKLTIHGKALNQEGKPVAGAKVHLVASNRTYTREAISETTANNMYSEMCRYLWKSTAPSRSETQS